MFIILSRYPFYIPSFKRKMIIFSFAWFKIGHFCSCLIRHCFRPKDVDTITSFRAFLFVPVQLFGSLTTEEGNFFTVAYSILNCSIHSNINKCASILWYIGLGLDWKVIGQSLQTVINNLADHIIQFISVKLTKELIVSSMLV